MTYQVMIMEDIRSRVLDALSSAEDAGYITRFMSVADLQALSYEILQFAFDDDEIDELDDTDYLGVFYDWVA